MKSNLLIISIFLVSSAIAQVSCPEVITQEGELAYVSEEGFPDNFLLGIDNSDFSVEIKETKEFNLFRNVDKNSIACIQLSSGVNATTRVYEKDKIILYTLYTKHVDYYIIFPRKGIDDIVFYRGNRQDFNKRSDNRIFNKKSTFPDFEEIKQARLLEQIRKQGQ